MIARLDKTAKKRDHPPRSARPQPEMPVRPFLAALLLLFAPAIAAAAGPNATPASVSEPGALCLPAVAAAERAEGIPPGLLRSIAFVESGRVDPVGGGAVPWPWTINAEGQGQYFETREAAIAATRALLAGGMRSIDVGCGQVNLLHHPAAFASLEHAFDPAINTAYAARFLRSLHAATGSWPFAAAAYHSQTPERGHAYALRVAAIWPDAHRHGPWPAAPADLPTGVRVSVAPARPDYSLFTPAFAARLRRMEEDRLRIGTAAPRTRPAAAARGDRLPPAPVVMLRAPVPIAGARPQRAPSEPAPARTAALANRRGT